MPPRRILLATDCFPPLIGGAEIQSHLLARELRARGHEVVVASVWQHGLPAVDEVDGVLVHRLRQLRTLPGLARAWRHHQPPYSDPITIAGLRRLVRTHHPDVVHAYGWFSYSCAAALVGTDIPLIVTARDYGYSCATRTLLHNGVPCTGPAFGKCLNCAAREYGRAKGTLAVLGVGLSAPLLRRKVRATHSISTYVQDIIRRDFLDDRERPAQTRAVVIHDMIEAAANDSSTDSIRESATASPDGLPAQPFLLFVGAFRRVKGVEQLLAAYERLRDPPPLVLIGTYERDSPPVLPPGVHVLTDVPHAAVMAAWERCLFAVLPSLLPEPFGTVVGEAMSRGKAVIGTKPGGHADLIVDGETGILVPAGDVDALTAAIERLLGDADLRARMGAAARARAKLFTPEVIVPRVERLYEDVLAPSGVRASCGQPWRPRPKP
jgi:glycosyltransferase involved in cell wall biosynthesis